MSAARARYGSTAIQELPHPVLVGLGHLTQFTVKVDGNVKVHVPLVSVVGGHGKGALDLLALLARYVVLQVEHSLFPVSVGGLGSRGETDPLVAVGELNVEERHQGLYVVVTLETDVPI